MNANDIKIKIQMKNKNTLLANATVSINTFCGFITIKGFQIWKSRNINERLGADVNITPPTKPAFGRYIHIVFFEDKNMWYDLEQEIHASFIKAQSEIQANEEVNIDEIPTFS